MDEREIKTQKVEDRISTLPDGVICHILSFLLTKEAVCPSALSTRWRYLFASVNVFRLYDFSGLNESQEVRGRKFTEFVNGLLNRHDVSDISLFDLSLTFGAYDISDVNSWISYAIRRNVRNINVMDHTPMISDGVRSLVPNLFTCKTLVDLYLFGEFDLSVPESVCLPNLKTCCLASFGIKFNDDGSAQMLFSSCPKLEKLNLLRCDMENIENLELHIPSLKMFNIDMIHADKILLDAPNLILNTFNVVGQVFCVKVFGSLSLELTS